MKPEGILDIFEDTSRDPLAGEAGFGNVTRGTDKAIAEATKRRFQDAVKVMGGLPQQLDASAVLEDQRHALSWIQGHRELDSYPTNPLEGFSSTFEYL
jgi:hypothetical protein